MSLFYFDLDPGWLRRCETRPDPRRRLFEQSLVEPPGMRSFKLDLAGECFVVSVRHVPASAAEAFSAPAEEPRTPTDGEVLGLFARIFLASLPQHPPMEPDVEAAWNAYREQKAETMSARFSSPGWSQLSSEHREAFACGVRAAFQPPTPTVKP